MKKRPSAASSTTGWGFHNPVRDKELKWSKEKEEEFKWSPLPDTSSTHEPPYRVPKRQVRGGSSEGSGLDYDTYAQVMAKGLDTAFLAHRESLTPFATAGEFGFRLARTKK